MGFTINGTGKVEITDLQVELGTQRTSYEKYQFKLRANTIINIEDKRDEITTNDYYIRIYKNEELIDERRYEEIGEDNRVDGVRKSYDVDEKSDYKIELLVKIVKGVRSLIFITWLTTFTINSALSSLQFTFLTLGSVLKDVYKKYNVNLGVLSRTMEEGGTLTEVLLPWTVTGVYMTSILGVHTLEYMPYSFFNLISIGISFIYMLTLPKFAVKINKN